MALQDNQIADRLCLDSIFEDGVTESARCLQYNLSLLKAESSVVQYLTNKLLYQVFTQEVDIRHRHRFFEAILLEVSAAHYDPTTMLVFIHNESDAEIIRLAVWTYLKHSPSTLDAPYKAVQDLMATLSNKQANKQTANRGAVFAAMVYFGDSHVCATARTIQDTITVAEARNFLKASTVPLQRASIEFCLLWLLDLAEQKKYEVLTHIASALSKAVIGDPKQIIRDRKFNFGPYGFASHEELPKSSLSELLHNMQPVLALLGDQNIVELDTMLAVFNNPSQRELHQKLHQGQQYQEQQHQEQRRVVTTRRNIESDRRDNERRVIDIMPHLERRSNQRRDIARRQLKRR